jgi:hypothetical protein
MKRRAVKGSVLPRGRDSASFIYSKRKAPRVKPHGVRGIDESRAAAIGAVKNVAAIANGL